MTRGRRVVTVTEATFDSVVLQARLPVLVDFWVEWPTLQVDRPDRRGDRDRAGRQAARGRSTPTRTPGWSAATAPCACPASWCSWTVSSGP